MTELRKLRVFLCHVSQDKPIVRELYQRLLAEAWINPWLDEERILSGQDWELEIEKAVETADSVIVCLSNNSITKEGYFQKELRTVLDKALEKPKGTIFVIPLRLEDCKPPKELRGWQYQDYFPETSQLKMHQRLLKSLQLRAKNLGIESSIPFEKMFLIGDLSFIKIPAGSFLMGSQEKIRMSFLDKEYEPTPVNEIPQTSISVSYNYWIGQFPVTNAQYSIYTKSNNISFQIPQGKESHPVVYISWYDALDYIDWFNDKYQKLLPKASVVTLPSESEWEKAARGRDGRAYPWGDSFDKLHPSDTKLDVKGKDLCNVVESGVGSTTPVDFYTPIGDSPYGVADLAGNVWEWTRSLWSSNANIREVSEPDYKYPYDPGDGREDKSVKGVRVLRGGSYFNSRWQARCASRGWDLANERYRYAGFRLAIVPIMTEL